MAELKRNIKCSNCSSETSVYLSSDLNINEILLHGRCSKCGNSLQLNFHLVDSSQAVQQAQADSSQSTDAGFPNIDQSLFGTGNTASESDSASDAIKDLIED